MENSSLQNGTSKSSADSFGFGLQLQSSGDESSSPESEPISSRALSLTKFSSSTTEIQTDPLSATGLVVCCFCHGQMEAKLPVALPKLLANNSRPPPALKVEPVDSDSAERSGSQPAEVTAVKRPRGRPPRNGYKKKRLDESTNEQNLRVKQAEEMRRTTRGSVATNSPTRRNSSLSNGSGRGSPRRIGRKRRLKAAACNLDISDESGNDEESSVMSTRKSVKISKSPSTVAAKRIRRAKYPVFGAQKKRKLCLAARRRVAQREAKKSGLRPNSNDDSSAGADERSEPDLQPSVMEFAEEKQQNEAVKAVSPLQCTANRTANNSFEQKFTEVEPEKALMTCAALVESDDNSEEKGAVVVKNVSPVKSEPSEIKLSMIPLQPQSPPLNLELSHSSGLASPGPNRTHCAQCDTYVAHLKYHVWARHCARMPYGCLQCDFRSWCQSYVVKHAKHKHTRASNALVSKPTIEMQNEYFKFYGLCFGQRVTHKMLSPGSSGAQHNSAAVTTPPRNSQSIADRLRPPIPKMEEPIEPSRSDMQNGSGGKNSREIHKISCRVCNERVSKAYITLSQHVWHHCTEFPFGCSLCDWKDLKTTAVEQHIRSNHPGQSGRVIPPSKQLKDEFSGKFSDCFTVTNHGGGLAPGKIGGSSAVVQQPSFSRRPSTSGFVGISKFPQMSMKKSLNFGPKFLQCELCDKKIMRKSTFSHAKTHLPAHLPKTFQCPYCSFGSHTNTYDVTFHVRSAHPGMADPIINRSAEHRDEAIHVKSLCFPSLSGGSVQRSPTTPVVNPTRFLTPSSQVSSTFTPIVRRSPFGGSRRLPEKTRNCQVCKKKTGWSSWRVHVFKHLFHNCGIARFECLACPYKTCWHEAIQNHCTGNMGKEGHPPDSNSSYKDNTESLKLEFEDMLERCFPDFHSDTGNTDSAEQQKAESNSNGVNKAGPAPSFFKSPSVQKSLGQDEKPPRAYSAGFYKVSPLHMTGRNTCLCKQCHRYIDPHTIKRHVYFHLHQDAKVSRFTCNHCTYRSCWSFMIQKHCKKASLKNHHPANASFSDNSELIQGDYDVMALKCFPHVLPMPSTSATACGGDYGDESAEESEEKSESNEIESSGGDYIEPQKYFQNAAEISNANIFAMGPSIASAPVSRIRPPGGPVNSRASSISRAAVAKGLDKLVCCQCGDSINTAPSSIDYHVWKKHCQRLPWSCELCGTRDVYPSWIKRHMDSRHGGAGGDPIPPEEDLKAEFLEMFDLCFDYPTNSTPKATSNFAGPSGSGGVIAADSVKCEKCHKVVLRRSSNKHIKWHMDRNLFECPYCSYGSKAVSSDVRNHLKMSHPEKEQRIVNHLLEYQEEICSLKAACFPTLNSKSPAGYNGISMSSSLIESSSHRHNLVDDSEDSGDNRLCHLCKKVMNRKSWKPHVFSHMFNDCGIPRYECQYCPYKTCWMFTIKEHCRNRSGKDGHPLNCTYKDNTDALGMEYDDMVDKCYPSYDLQYSEPSAMLRFSDEDEGDTYGDDEEIQGDSARLANLTGVAEFADELMGEEEDVDEAEYDGQME